MLHNHLSVKCVKKAENMANDDSLRNIIQVLQAEHSDRIAKLRATFVMKEQTFLLDQILLDHRKLCKLHIIDLIARQTNIELKIE